MSGMALARRTGAYVWLLADAHALRSSETDEPSGIAALPDATLLEALRRLSDARRTLDAERARVAAEVARRSEPADESSLARRNGERNAVALVARETGSSATAARPLVDVGGAIASRRSLTGEPLPPAHPHLAAAVQAGQVSLELSRLILAALRKVEPVLSSAQLLDLEAHLVATAVTWGAGYETLVGY